MQTDNNEVNARIISTVMNRVSRARRFRLRVILTGHGIIGSIALVALVVAIRWSISASQQSGFGRYVGLFASDTAQALGNWKALLITIAQSLPIFELTLAIGSVLVLANALRLIARNMSANLLRPGISN